MLLKVHSAPTEVQRSGFRSFRVHSVRSWHQSFLPTVTICNNLGTNSYFGGGSELFWSCWCSLHPLSWHPPCTLLLTLLRLFIHTHCAPHFPTDILFADIKDVIKYWTYRILPDRSLLCVRQLFYTSFIQPNLFLDSNSKFTPSYDVPPTTCNSLLSTNLRSGIPIHLPLLLSACFQGMSLVPRR